MVSKGPQFTRYMAPILDALRSLGGSGRPNEVERLIADRLGLSQAELDETIRSGQPRVKNQIHWARYYLTRAGYLHESSPRGVWSLTDEGTKTHLARADAIRVFNEVHPATRRPAKGRKAIASAPEDEAQTDPPPGVEADYRQGLLSLLKGVPPAGFERMSQKLLREAGFEQVVVTGKSGDGGIDGHGILVVNPLVSFRVVFQCKRYAGSVGADEVRQFRGAMDASAEKGIILTTGSFTAAARDEAVKAGFSPIELVDGEKLVSLCEQLEFGLKPARTYRVERQFFTEFQ